MKRAALFTAALLFAVGIDAQSACLFAGGKTWGARYGSHHRALHPSRAARVFVALEDPGRDLYSLVTAIAARHGVPSRLAHAIVRIESRYRCDARNQSGARGIMQVLPRTAAGVGVAGNLLDCATGLEAGMRYLSAAIALGGAGCVGASLYNSGIGGRRQCTAYGRRVVSLAGGA